MMRALLLTTLLFAPALRADDTPTTRGPTGLLHTPSALATPPGTVRSALFVDWFRASGFLCTEAKPCGATTSDEHAHSGLSAVVSATVFTGLDAYLVGRAYTNQSSVSPDLFHVFGDATLGARYVHALGPLHVGTGAELLTGGGPGSVGLAGGGTSFRLRALSTWAPNRARVHLAVGYLFDNSGALVRDIERERGAPITRVERYSLGINRVDQLEANLGVELAASHVQPFVEYGVRMPVNRQHFRCVRALGEACVNGAIPSQVTFGARATPVRGLSFLVGLDIGVTGTTRFVSAMTPQAPYTLWMGIALSLETREKPAQVVVERVEVPIAPPVVTIRGFVHASGGKAPIADARITFASGARPPLLTGADGYFGADLPPGTYEFRVRAEGFKENTCGGTAVGRRDKVNMLLIDCPLEPDAK